VSILALSLAMVPVAAYPQTFADMAKKEKTRRKDAPSAPDAKTYKDSDLPGYSPVAPEEPSPEPEKSAMDPVWNGGRKSATPRESASAKAARDQNLRATWRARAASARARLQSAEETVKSLDTSRVGGIQMRSCTITAVSRDGELATRCSQARTLFKMAQQAVQQAKAELASLEIAAHRAGVPAAWLY
jgi:hypothetical protein